MPVQSIPLEQRLYVLSQKLKLLSELSSEKDNAIPKMMDNVLNEHNDVKKTTSFISEFKGPPKGSDNSKIFQSIKSFESKRLSSEVFSALERVLNASQGTRKGPLKILYSKSLHGQLIVSVSVRDDDRFFGKSENSCLHDVLHRGLAYVIDLNDQVQRLNGVPKFFEQEKDYAVPKKVISRSIALKLNGEFIVVTFSKGWLYVQSKTSPKAVYIGVEDEDENKEDQRVILINALRDLNNNIKIMMNETETVPQTNQAMAIVLVKLLRLGESDRKTWLSDHDGHQFLCELETGRHFVQHQGEPTLTVFSKWVGEKQLFPEDLEPDGLFNNVKCIPCGATEEEVQGFIDLHKFDEGCVLVEFYDDGTFRRFKIKGVFYNQVLKGMPTKPTGLRYIFMNHLKNDTIMPKDVQVLPEDLQAIIDDYGVKIGDENWYIKVWKALRCLTMMAKLDETVKIQMNKLIYGNRGWSAVGFREVIEALRQAKLKDLEIEKDKLEEKLSDYFSIMKNDKEITELLKSKGKELEEAKKNAKEEDKRDAAAILTIFIEFMKEKCTAFEYISKLEKKIGELSSPRKKIPFQTKLNTFQKLLNKYK